MSTTDKENKVVSEKEQQLNDLEELDEFEDFPKEEWEEEEKNVLDFKETWDDDDEEADFSAQLRDQRA